MIDGFMSRIQGTQIGSTRNATNGSSPIIVSVEMGYGHLRAANAIAESLGTEVIRLDLPPVAGRGEAALWCGIRKFYNGLSQACDWPVVGTAAQAILEKITEIKPLLQHRNSEPPNLLAHLTDGLSGTVLGRRLRTIAAGRPILATYPAAAMAALHAPGARIFCLVTDTDLNRAWAPLNPRGVCIEYLAPVTRVVDRLRSFGVPDQRIHLTGFPLPAKLTAQAKPALARRLHRLDPARAFRSRADKAAAAFVQEIPQPASTEPMVMTVAIGGAGGQTGHVDQILKSVRKRVLDGKLKLNLVAGTRADLVENLRKMVRNTGLSLENNKGVEILFAAEHKEYFRLFDNCLAATDLLWTKPSELVFYAALGLPILLAPPLGGQEHANRDWLLSNDAALDTGNPATLDRRLEELLTTGALCRVAWNGYSRLERGCLDRIFELMDSVGRRGLGSVT
jgi:hypothetical protein